MLPNRYKDGLDRIDRKILSALRRNGRISNLDLARSVHLSPTPCLRRVKALEEAGFIVGYRAELERRKLGFGVRAFVGIVRDKSLSKERLWEDLSLFPEIVDYFVVSGEFDLLLDVVSPDLDAYASYLLERLMKIPGVLEVRSMFVLRESSRERPTIYG